MPDDFDYGSARSTFLEEVRTVLSRAETALNILQPRGHDDDSHPRPPERYYLEHPQPIFSETELDVTTWTDRFGHEHTYKNRKFMGYTEGKWIPHPGYDEGVAALQQVVDKLSKFRKTRKKKRR